MDTKQKKWIYTKWVKGVAVILIALGVIGLMQGVFNGLGTQSYRWLPETFYDTPQFENYAARKAGLVRDWITRYADPKIFDSETIPKNQIKEYTKYEIDKAGSKEKLIQSIEQRGGELYENVDQTIDEYVKHVIIEDRKTYYSHIQANLIDNNATFMFLGVNNQTGDIVTNIPGATKENKETTIKRIKNQPYHLEGNTYDIKLPNGTMDKNSDYYDGNTRMDIASDDYSIYAYQLENSEASNRNRDWFIESKARFDEEKAMYNQISENVETAEGMIVVLLLLGVAGVVLLTWSAGHHNEEEGIVTLGVDCIPLDIQLVVVAGLGIVSLWVVVMLTSLAKPEEVVGSMQSFGILSQWPQVFITLAYTGLALVTYTSIVRSIKARCLLRRTLIGKVGYFIYEEGLKSKNITAAAVFAVAGYLGGNIILMLFIAMGGIFFIIPLFIFNVILFIFLMKWTMEYKSLLGVTHRMAQGDLDIPIKHNQSLPALKELGNDLSHMKDAIQVAAEKATKSEKMKTELITNVSHDLKTPLTSIISYIELLEQEDLESETAKEYVGILSERSQRLKFLIEDLVEASKAASGAVEVNGEVMALDQLMDQFLGEYADEFDKKHLQSVMLKKEHVLVEADPRHIWRIIDNLLSNVKKYAMPGTRVYVEVRREKEYGVVEVKNISKDPIADATADLTERFVRGDSARSTEGSGLGLAIAMNLATLQRGQLDVNVDGDLFKVQVRFPSVEVGNQEAHME